jgi:hypothetical protein
MQEKPDRLELLSAIAEFLMNEVRPAISDARLSFRVLIAANLAQIVAGELRAEPQHEAAARERLRALLPDVTAGDPRAIERELAARLRDGRISGEALERARALVRDTLRDQLSVNNPLFDTRAEVE